MGKKKIKLTEFNRLYPILPEVYEIVSLVEQKTGKGIDFQVHEMLQVDGLVKIARINMPKHILKVRASKVKNINEMIAHECGHALRMFSVEPSARKIPCSTNLNTVQAIADLDAEKSNVRHTIKKQMYDTWINWIVLQVNNLPADVRIERWIYDSYPGLRKEQENYLIKLAEICVSAFSKEVENMTPPKVYRCNMSMVFAFLKAIGILLGKDYSRHFSDHPECIDNGQILHRLLEEPDRGYLQDMETTNYWAKILGLSNWFSWTDFENVPEGYAE